MKTFWRRRGVSMDAQQAEKMQLAPPESAVKMRLDAETAAVEKLMALCKTYRDNLESLASTSAELSNQFALFYGPDHPKRQLVEQLRNGGRDLNVQVSCKLLDGYNANVLGPPTDYLLECERVQTAIKSNENLAAAEKGAKGCHDRIAEIIEPTLLRLLVLQADVHKAAERHYSSLVEKFNVASELEQLINRQDEERQKREEELNQDAEEAEQANGAKFDHKGSGNTDESNMDDTLGPSMSTFSAGFRQHASGILPLTITMSELDHMKLDETNEDSILHSYDSPSTPKLGAESFAFKTPLQNTSITSLRKTADLEDIDFNSGGEGEEVQL